MTDTDSKPNVERLYECLTDGRYEEARTFLHPDYHSNTQPYETSADALFEEVEAIKQAMTSLRRETILTMVDGDMEVILQRVEGHRPGLGRDRRLPLGPISSGRPPTGASSSTGTR